MEALCGAGGLLAHNRTLRGLHLAANSLGNTAVVRLLLSLATIRRNTLSLDRGTGAAVDEAADKGDGANGDDGLAPPAHGRSFSWVKGLLNRISGGPAIPHRVVSVLRTLDLRANGLCSDAVTAALVKLVEHNRSLRELLLQGNRLSEDCGMKLCIAALRNPQLWYLRLAGNHSIRAKDRAEICRSMRHNRTMWRFAHEETAAAGEPGASAAEDDAASSGDPVDNAGNPGDDTAHHRRDGSDDGNPGLSPRVVPATAAAPTDNGRNGGADSPKTKASSHTHGGSALVAQRDRSAAKTPVLCVMFSCPLVWIDMNHELHAMDQINYEVRCEMLTALRAPAHCCCCAALPPFAVASKNDASCGRVSARLAMTSACALSLPPQSGCETRSRLGAVHCISAATEAPRTCRLRMALACATW